MRRLFLFLIFVPLVHFSTGQACGLLSYDCGNIVAAGGLCDTSQTIFCITDSVGVKNRTQNTADSTFICWGDGTISRFLGNYQNCVAHRYTFPEDSCPPNGTGKITIQIEIGVALYCAAGVSYHYILTPITIKFKPRASFSIPTNDTCYSGPVVFNNTSCPNSSTATYLWDFGDGTSSTLQSPPNHQYVVPGPYTIRLTVTNSCGSSTTTRTIRVRPATVVSPIISLLNNCAPTTFSPDINSLNALTYSWTSNFSTTNIVNPTDSQPTFNIINQGNYTIRLNVTGCCQSSTLSHCTWDTTLNFIAGPTTAQVPIPDFCDSALFNPTTYFIATGVSITGYNWSFPGGTPSSSQQANPGNINYSTTGTYPVTLTLSTTCGPRTLTDTFQVGAPAVLNIVPTSLIGCDTLNAAFNNTSPANQTYVWSAPGGSFNNGTNSTSASPVIHFGIPGTYTVNVQASSGACTPQSTSYQVVVGAGPVLSLHTAIPDICDTITFNFSDYFQWQPAPSDSGYLWTITSGGATLYSNTTPSPPPFNITATGSYIASASIWNNCDSIIISETFNYFNPTPLQLPSDTSVCFGTPLISLNASPAGGSWSIGGQPLIGDFNPAAVTSPINYLTYSYGSSTCLQRDSFLVTVFGAGTSAGSDTGLCDNAGIIQLSFSPAGGIWQGNGIIDSIAGTYSPNSNSGSQDVLYYNLSEPNLGCMIRDSMIITIYSPTTSTLTIPDTACIGQVVLFGNSTASNSSTWNFGDGSPSLTSASASHAFPNPGNYTISVYSVNQFGCIDTFQTPIEVARPPDASFTLTLDNGCAPLSVPIQNSSTFYGGTQYSWNFGNGNTDTNFQPGTIIFNQGPGDSTLYEITLTSSNVCGSATYLDTIIVYPIPIVDFGVSIVDSCSPSTVQFYNITTGNPEFYSWYIDGVFQTNDSALTNQVFTTDSTDRSYEIMLISSNGCGSDTMQRTVTVHPNTVYAFFNADVTYGCRPLTVDFSSFVLPNAVIQWKFGDGNSANGYNVTHTFDTTGIFTVWQYVDNYCGFDSVSQVIEVLPQPILSFKLDSLNCGNELVQITNTSPNIQGAYWDFGDGSPIDSFNISPGHYYNSPGIYPVTLVGVAAATGCLDTLTLNANVIGYPNASFSVNDNDGCAPLTIQLSSNSHNGNYYLWSLGNGDSLTGTNTVYTYLNSGSYTLIHSVIDTNGCKDDTVFNTIMVYPVPVADFTTNQTLPCQLPTSIQFNNTSIGASNFNWDFGSYGQYTYQDPLVQFSSVANFNASLIALNNFGCSDTVVKPIEVYDKAIADFDVQDFLACPDQPIEFLNLSQNINAFLWDFGNSTYSNEQNPVISYPTPGSYSISLYVNNDSVCFDSLSRSGYIVINPQPTSAFTFNQVMDTIVNPSGIYEFTDQSIDAVRWEWNFSDGTIDSVENPIHRWYSNGLKTITQICYNQFGCPDTSFDQLTIDYLHSLFIPNAFTPGVGNDETGYFIPKGVGLKYFLIEIFSPYGELVWYSDKLVDGQPVEKWDGNHNGTPVPQGGYAWKVQAVFQNGVTWSGMRYNNQDRFRTSGSVNVIR